MKSSEARGEMLKLIRKTVDPSASVDDTTGDIVYLSYDTDPPRPVRMTTRECERSLYHMIGRDVDDEIPVT